MAVNFKVDNCGKCPNIQSERVYTADSFENVFKFTCTKVNRVVDELDTFEKFGAIPKWCPLRKE